MSHVEPEPSTAHLSDEDPLGSTEATATVPIATGDTSTVWFEAQPTLASPWSPEPEPEPEPQPQPQPPIQDSPAPAWSAYGPYPAGPSSRPARAAAAMEVPRRPTGPNAVAIVLGLLCMAIAAMEIVVQNTGAIIHWSSIGPAAIVVAGAVFLVAGLTGLVRRR